MDVENLRWHYWRTLRCWLERYEQATDEIVGRFGAPFGRAWLLYLAGSAAAFESGTLQLFQVLFFPSRAGRLPASRAHLYTPEAPKLRVFSADPAIASTRTRGRTGEY